MMKCEKCNEREAVLHYKSDINGEKTEKHLCAECAKEEGYGSLFETNTMRMGLMNDFFRDPFEGLFEEFFGRRSLFPSLAGSLLAPAVAMPRIEIRVGEEAGKQECAEKGGSKIPESAGEEFRGRRELSALRHQLKEAVKAEDFEKAIELRDKIKKLES